MRTDNCIPCRETVWAAEIFEDTPVLRADFDRCSEGVYFVDQQGRITYWSHGAEKITGFLQHEVLGRQCSEHDLLVHCDDSGAILCQTACPLRATGADGKCREIRVHLRHHDGYRVPVRVRAIPLTDQEGRRIGVAEVFAAPEASRLDTHRRHVFPVALIQIPDIESIRRRYGFDGASHLRYCVERTLRRELDPASALGRLGASSFIAVLGEPDSRNPKGTLDRIQHIVEHTDTLWWGDAVDLSLVATYTWIFPGEPLDRVIRTMEAKLNAARDALHTLS